MKSFIYNTYYIFKKEVNRILHDHGVLVFFIALTLLYPMVYTYIYSREVVEEVPVAVVEHSDSELARKFIRNWDATSSVDVTYKCSDLEEAKELMRTKKIYGILDIPKDFNKRIIRGQQGHIFLYADMGAFVNYKAVMISAVDVAFDMGDKIKLTKFDNGLASISPAQIKSSSINIFNPQSGFATFLIPAVLILIIQQSLLLGVGMIAGTTRDTSRFGIIIPHNSHYRNPFAVSIGKMLAYLPIYIFVSLWVFFIVPGIFNLTRIGVKIDLMIFLIPFLFACIFFAQSLSFICKERESPFLVFVFTSVPLMFISGVSWPIEAIPEYWRWVAKIFPSTHGIQGYVKINTMGIGLSDVMPEFISMWILAVAYMLISVILYRRHNRRSRI